MSELVYVDTNVWLDYIYDRKDNLRPLGAFAFELLRKAIQCQYTIIISDWTVVEIEKHKAENELHQALQWLKQANKLLWVHSTHTLRQQARKSNHWQDELHALLAIKARASFLATRNISDFSNRHTFQVVLPEQL